MNTDNQTRREIKLRYLRRRADLQLELDRKQVEISRDIELTMNERSMLLTRAYNHEDVKDELDALTERIHALRLQKVDIDYRRKLAVAECNAERDEALRLHELPLVQVGGAELQDAIAKAAEKYGNGMLSYVKSCSDSNEDYARGVEDYCEESFIAGVNWLLQHLNLPTKEGGEL